MKLQFKKIGHTLIVTIVGELDHHSATAAREHIEQKINSLKTKNLVFDLQKLQFMDSSGLGVIIGRYKSVTAIGGKTYIAKPSPVAKRLIVLAGIHKIIPLCQNIEEVLGGAV